MSARRAVRFSLVVALSAAAVGFVAPTVELEGEAHEGTSQGAFGCGCSTPDNASFNPVLGSGSNRAIQLGLKFIF